MSDHKRYCSSIHTHTIRQRHLVTPTFVICEGTSWWNVDKPCLRSQQARSFASLSLEVSDEKRLRPLLIKSIIFLDFFLQWTRHGDCLNLGSRHLHNCGRFFASSRFSLCSWVAINELLASLERPLRRRRAAGRVPALRFVLGLTPLHFCKVFFLRKAAIFNFWCHSCRTFI